MYPTPHSVGVVQLSALGLTLNVLKVSSFRGGGGRKGEWELEHHLLIPGTRTGTAGST